MNIPTNNNNNLAYYAACVTQLLSSFSDKREGLILVYLLSLADDEGRVSSSAPRTRP